MRVKEVSVSIAATVNLGNYENVRPHVGVVMELDPGDDEKEAYKAAWTTVANQLASQWENVKKLKG